MTLQFISALLAASKAEQDRFFARQLPQGIFQTNQAQVKWLYDYRQRFGCYPSRTAFKGRFPQVTLPPAEPLDTTLATVIDADVFAQLSTLVERGRELHESGRPIRDVVEFFRRASSAVRLYETSFTEATMSYAEAFKSYRQKLLQQSRGLLQPSSPWPTFNNLAGYFEPGEMVVLAARPSLGKTWCAMYWSDYLARIGERVLFVSKELPTSSVMRRWAAMRLKLNAARLRHGKLRPTELARFLKAARRIKQLDNIMISGYDTVSGVGFGHIHQSIQTFHPTVLVVDGAYLIYPEDQKFNSDVQRFGYISSTLKRMSLAYGMRTIAVVQAKREAEAESISGVTKAGIMHIYGADTWAHDADWVVLLNGKRGGAARTLSLEKAREGEVGSWGILFQLDPYPIFSESGTVAEENDVQFQGV